MVISKMIINHPFLSSNHLNLFAYHYKYTTIFFFTIIFFFFGEIKIIINKEPNNETLRINIYIYIYIFVGVLGRELVIHANIGPAAQFEDKGSSEQEWTLLREFILVNEEVIYGHYGSEGLSEDECILS